MPTAPLTAHVGGSRATPQPEFGQLPGGFNPNFLLPFRPGTTCGHLLVLKGQLQYHLCESTPAPWEGSLFPAEHSSLFSPLQPPIMNQHVCICIPT